MLFAAHRVNVDCNLTTATQTRDGDLVQARKQGTFWQGWVTYELCVALKNIASAVKLGNFAMLGGKLTGNTAIGVKTVRSKENKDNVISWGDVPRGI